VSGELRRIARCTRCGRPHLTDGRRFYRGCLCHWLRETRYRCGPSHGEVTPVATPPEWPWGRLA